MYQKILICTDGSEFSAKAEQHGIELARAMSANVVAVMVTSPIYAGVVGEALAYAADLEAQAIRNAKTNLSRLEAECRKALLEVETVHVQGVLPYEGIVATADDKGCDLIVIGSHGWRGLQKLFLGSETQKVITHAHVPVLVYR